MTFRNDGTSFGEAFRGFKLRKDHIVTGVINKSHLAPLFNYREAFRKWFG